LAKVLKTVHVFFKEAERKTGAYLSLWENFRRKGEKK